MTIRRGGPDDLETRCGSTAYPRAQAASPSFSGVPLDEEVRRQDWVETLAGDDVLYFVAERDGATVAHLTLYPDPHDEEAPTSRRRRCFPRRAAAVSASR